MNRVPFAVALLAGAAGISTACFSSSNGSGPKDGGVADGTSSSSGGGSGSGSGSGSGGSSGSGSGSGGSSGSGSSSGSSGGSSGSGGGDGGSPCPNPRTTFAFTGQGDTNSNFNSAVGARSTNALFLFSGYIGPDPNGDGGGPNVGAMFAQAFDPSTAASLGPSKLLILGVNSGGNSFGYLFSSAIAPTGQIAVLYAATDQGVPVLSAAFLTPSSDAGVGLGGGVGLQVERQVVVASSYSSDGDETQPQAIWSNASDSFVFSYGVNSNGLQIVLSEYSADGAASGNYAVPTDSTTSTENIRTSAGVSGNLIGVPFLSTLSSTKGYPGLSVVNPQGTQVGSSIYIANAAVEYPETIAVAGTPQGFVAAYSEQTSTLVTFIAASSSGIVADGGAFPTMTLKGGATGGAGLLAVSDDVGAGGANGVGLALQFNPGLSFAYVSADGSQVLGPTSVFPYTGSTQFSMTNYNGSTVLTLSGPNNSSAQIAASGCQ